MTAPLPRPAETALDRLQSQDWGRLRQDILTQGYATLKLLDEGECAQLRALYADDGHYRKQVIMARHAYGRGEYKYFRYPLPDMLADLRAAFYRELAPAANLWAERLDRPVRYPAELETFTSQCHALGQLRPTPLMLKYGAGDYNRLHQDLYGDLYFPFQAAVLLNEPGKDFTGGEFVLVESRPRVQSRPIVVPLRLGDAIVFSVNERPDKGVHGWRKAALRHGVSEIRSGERYTLGLIMHDAR